MSDQHIGLRRQKNGVFTAGQILALVLAIVVTGALVFWHLTLVLMAGIPFSEPGLTLRALLRGAPLSGLPASYSPSTGPTLAVYGVVLLIWIGLIIALGVVLSGRKPPEKILGVADGTQVRASAGEQRARDKAAWSRRLQVESGALDVTTADLKEVGTLLGYNAVDGEPMIITLEDQVGILAATGRGKTLYLMVGVALDAPGPLVSTSTKPEVLDAIVEARAGMGRIWVWDPLNLANWPEPMIWNPVSGAEISQAAVSAGLAFAAGAGVEGGPDANPFFTTAAGLIIARYLHAAALAGHTLEKVLSWAVHVDTSTEALNILRDDPRADIFWADSLEATTTGASADETTSSIKMTLGQKIEPLLSRQVLRQMLPRPGVEEFDAAKFVRSNDTLVLITDDNQPTNVAPLSTMLLQKVIDAAKASAAMSLSGRLDPILRIDGDELANVAPLPKLPALLSDSRGAGIQWFCAFQSLSQMINRWGTEGANQILGNVNVLMALGGLLDTAALEHMSALVGKTDFTQISESLTVGNQQAGTNVSLTERQVLAPEQIRQLPDGKALVIYANAPAMIIDMVPWTARPDAAAVAAGIQHIRRIRIGDGR